MFASLYGTYMLLNETEKKYIKGTSSISSEAISRSWSRAKCWKTFTCSNSRSSIHDSRIDDEDSLSSI